ncbi:glycosyltransferase [Dankookia sp. P2]|uniref:glycosyltransferase n=1 Tax=Dankookia sp. P2 TaxID=3423955 RepID=UPI003D6692B6
MPLPGEPGDARLWSRLAALWIDWQFLPNAALGEAMGRAHGCYGATMSLRAETLARLGGFAALSDLLADDHALGVAVRRLGLRVVVAPVLPAHVMAEASLPALVRHELRWARTLRLLDLPGYAGMGVTFPLSWGALAAALVPWGWLTLAVALVARLALAIRVDRALRRCLNPGRLALLPLRDALSFAIWGLGLARGTVTWQGRRFRMRPDGSMVEAG